MKSQLLNGMYRMEELIGRGAMGQVWRGSSVETGTPVAIKVLRPELSENPDLVARFHREGSIMMAVNHPCVVGVLDVVSEGGVLAIVMDLIAGGDLRAYLVSFGTLPLSEALRLTGQVLAGLDAVHRSGILHRDLKPENILIDKTGSRGPVARLTDFGIGRFADGATITNVSGVIGTPQYLAPEVIQNGRASTGSDLYSAGVVLYELITGRAPFSAPHPAAVLRQHLEELPSRPEEVPDEVWSFLQRLLAKDPLERPASAAEAARECAQLARSQTAVPANGRVPGRLVDHPTISSTLRAPQAPQEPTSDAGTAPSRQHFPGSPTVSPGRSGRKALSIAFLIALTLLTVRVFFGSLQDVFDQSLDRTENLEQIDPLIAESAPRKIEPIDVTSRTVIATLRSESVSPEINPLEQFEVSRESLIEDTQRWLESNDLTSSAPRIDPRWSGYGDSPEEADLNRRIPATYRGLPLARIIRDSERVFLLFGERRSESGFETFNTRYLVAVDPSFDDVLYALDFALYLQNSQGVNSGIILTVEWALERRGTLFFSTSGQLNAVDPKTGRFLWRTGYSGAAHNFGYHNGHIFWVTQPSLQDSILGAKNRMSVIDATSGATLQAIEMKESPEWLAVKGNRLFTHGFGHDAVFDLTA